MMPIKMILEAALDLVNFEPIFLFYHRDSIPELTSEVEEKKKRWVTLGDGLYDKGSQNFFLDNLRKLIRASEEVLFFDWVTSMAYAALEGKSILCCSLGLESYPVKLPFGPINESFYHEAKIGLGYHQKLKPHELQEVLRGERRGIVGYSRQEQFMSQSITNLKKRMT